MDTMTKQQADEYRYLLSLATEETSTSVMFDILQILKKNSSSDNGGLEELGYILAGKLIERGAL